MTTRIRINEHSPWPERIGCVGSVAIPPEHRQTNYPVAGLGKNWVIVLLDDDPLAPRPCCGPFAQRSPGDAWWTCVMPADAVEPLP